MRILYLLLLSCVLVLAAGCSKPEGTSYPAPVPDDTPSLYPPESPVDTSPAAITIGTKLLEDKGIIWIESPTVAFAEEMSYAEASERIGLGNTQYDLWPPETRVWFVIFNGRWQLIPLDPNQAAPQPLSYEGCLLLVFTAGEGEFLAMGDAVCPTH